MGYVSEKTQDTYHSIYSECSSFRLSLNVLKNKLLADCISRTYFRTGQRRGIYMQQNYYAPSGQTLLIELQNYEKQGISIWLEGLPSNSAEVSEAMCVREDNNYMRDYVFQQGALSELRFDKITKK